VQDAADRSDGRTDGHSGDRAGWRRYPTLRALVAACRWARRTFWTTDFLRDATSWMLVTALSVGATAFVIDLALLAQGDKSPSSALTVASTGAALGVLLAWLVGPLLAALNTIYDQVVRNRTRWRWLAFASVIVVSMVISQFVVPSFEKQPRLHYLSLLLGTALFSMMWWMGRSTRRPLRLALLLLGVAALLLDAASTRQYYRDLHDFAGLVGGAALLMGLGPTRSRLRELPRRRLVVLSMLLLGASIIDVSWVDWVAPGWRAVSTQAGHHAPRLARLFRQLFDLDADGFSPVAWGGDCDDFDSLRNPLARESRVGHDDNCNGIRLPAQSSDLARGLERPAGDPDLPAGAIDRVILVTVDCMRGDAFRHDLMPKLSEFAKRGLVMQRMYSGGARTHLSLPLLQRGSDDAVPVAKRLAPVGVTSIAVLGYMDEPMKHISAGFKLITSTINTVPWHPELNFLGPADPTEGRFDARIITDRAIAVMRHTEGPLYLWLHYFDAHVPYALAKRKRIDQPVNDPYEDYLAELRYIDAQLGRLFDELVARGRLEHTAVIVTADHGEGFGDHGVKYHGISEYEAQIHVPGIFVAPGIAPGTYDGLVSHRDVPATVLGAFGRVTRDPTIELFGRSWLRLRGAPTAKLHRFVVSRSSRSSDVRGFIIPMAAIVEGRYKLIKTFEDGLRELYDELLDPDELSNLEPERRAVTGKLDAELELFRDLDGYP
jgi:hypothetical protein